VPIKITHFWGVVVAGGDEVLFEFSRVGNFMRVTAVHVGTNTEVVIAGPLNAPQAALQNTALQKLRYVLAKKRGESP
jgi:hypothetical protein